MFNASFWQESELILKICAPILKILRLADREGATMGLVYELTDRMVEQFENMQGVDANTMEEIKNLCIDRWDMMHTFACCGLYVASCMAWERPRY